MLSGGGGGLCLILFVCFGLFTGSLCCLGVLLWV